MNGLFAKAEILESGFIEVGQGHSLYYETSGNPSGTPVLFIHGGPGAGLPPNYTQFFDPKAYFIIGFDQRGCGRSKPFATLSHNSTQHLLADIRQLRVYLGISQWVIFGGSWGATLALLSAIDDQQAVLGLILRGTFLARTQDRDWFLSPHGGAAKLFPEAYHLFTNGIDQPTSESILAHYADALTQRNMSLRYEAACRWVGWEDALSRLSPYHDEPAPMANAPMGLITSMALFESHFLTQQCFVPENYILDNIHLLTNIPVQIVHGRYDTVCPPTSAYSLHKALPLSELHIVPMAGHSTSDPAIAQALINATHKMVAQLNRRAKA